MIDILWVSLSASSAVLWILILLLPWRPWGTRERLESDPRQPRPPCGNVTVLIPARNEAGTIVRTIESLQRQDKAIRVVVVDDRSDDDTAGAARSTGLTGLVVIRGRRLPNGWTGKLWALEQGLAEVDTDHTLLLDADIELADGTLEMLLDFSRRHRLQLVSLMASLSMTGFWEKLLMPAFIYFFKMLYPFRLANAPGRRFGAAAGGCMLVETAVLRGIGGFSGVRGELIDDCALAARFKRHGHRIWIGLSRSVTSHRSYCTLRSVWEMVSRTAYTQLHYSPLLLVGCVLVLGWAFWTPAAGLFAPSAAARVLSAVALLAMMLTYLPVLGFYGRNPLWAGLLPVIAALYLAMTLDSARRYLSGQRSSWRGRVYGRR